MAKPPIKRPMSVKNRLAYGDSGVALKKGNAVMDAPRPKMKPKRKK